MRMPYLCLAPRAKREAPVARVAFMTDEGTTSVRIPTGGCWPVWADLYPAADRLTEPAADCPMSVVVLCHGFKGYRRWGFIPLLARRLCDAGLVALAIDFSHNGTDGGDPPSPTEPNYRRPQRFRRNTMDRERRELVSVIRWLRDREKGPFPRGVNVGLWGHSRGGVVALLAALDDPSISAVATWSAPVRPDNYTARQMDRWREQGEYAFIDSATGQRLALGLDHLEDLSSHRAEYAVGERAARLSVPHLVVHGELDLVAPVLDAETFSRGAGAGTAAPKKLVRLRTGHTYGVGAGGSMEALERAIAETVEWFAQHLKTGEKRL